MSETIVNSKGAVVIPSGIRRKLRIKPGDRVRFRETREGTVVVEPDYDLLDLVGMLDSNGVHLTVEDMERISANAALIK